jgi:hypothetical protein
LSIKDCVTSIHSNYPIALPVIYTILFHILPLSDLSVCFILCIYYNTFFSVCQSAFFTKYRLTFCAD